MMKNTFSFRHDFGARNDPKIRKMISRLGPAAGWAWWVTVEELYEQGGRLPLDSIPEIAYDARVDAAMVESIIHDFGLFKVDKKEFYSLRIEFELKDKESRSEAARKTANARWQREKDKNNDANKNNNASGDLCEGNADAMQTHSECNAINEIKGKESNGKEEIDAGASSSVEPEGGALFPDEKQGRITATQFVEVWNRVITETQAPIKTIEAKALSDKAREKVQIRIREMARLGAPLEILEIVMRHACASRFCCGATNSGWRMKFDWLIKNGENWTKVYQGDYDDNKPATPATGYDRLHIPARCPEDYEGDF